MSSDEGNVLFQHWRLNPKSNLTIQAVSNNKRRKFSQTETTSFSSSGSTGCFQHWRFDTKTGVVSDTHRGGSKPQEELIGQYQGSPKEVSSPPPFQAPPPTADALASPSSLPTATASPSLAENAPPARQVSPRVTTQQKTWTFTSYQGGKRREAKDKKFSSDNFGEFQLKDSLLVAVNKNNKRVHSSSALLTTPPTVPASPPISSGSSSSFSSPIASPSSAPVTAPSSPPQCRSPSPPPVESSSLRTFRFGGSSPSLLIRTASSYTPAIMIDLPPIRAQSQTTESENVIPPLREFLRSL